MNSTLASEAVSAWLLSTLEREEVTGAWLYGSFVRGATNLSDVDVIARFRRGWAGEAAKFRRTVEANFTQEFALPLHAIFLSEDEFSAEAEYLTVLLNESCRLR